ncbi:MAG: hypothetical protein ACK5CO_00480, partial [Bacteroidota bacterium]
SQDRASTATLLRRADRCNTAVKNEVGKVNAPSQNIFGSFLQKNQLEYIPEAHCYLKYKDQILDQTKINTKATDIIDYLIEEIEISPEQITDYKVNYHKSYLAYWLAKNKQIKLSTNDIWNIREQCIKDLANN